MMRRIGWRLESLELVDSGVPWHWCVGDHTDPEPAGVALVIGEQWYPLCENCRDSLAHLLRPPR